MIAAAFATSRISSRILPAALEFRTQLRIPVPQAIARGVDQRSH
jgi:hypothetical protein